jgi:hypothetical protein
MTRHLKAMTVFRLLVLFIMLLPGVVFLVGAFAGLPPPLLEYVQSQQHRQNAGAIPIGPFGFAFLLAIVLVLISIFIGLWRFRRVARTFYLILTLLYACYLPFIGPLVLPAAVVPVVYLAYLAQGALLAMAYLPPVGDLFSAQQT